MSLEKRIRETITPIVTVCKPDYYGGEEEIYCTFGYTEIPDSFGDNKPGAYRCLVDLHFFAPRGLNTVRLRRKIRSAVTAVDDWTAPTVTNASDDDGQHFVFEFEALGDLSDG